MRKKRSLLIVDDEPEIRLLLGKYAEKNGYTPRMAADGQEALGLIDQYQPDAIISDIRMPNLDGMELLREIKTRGIDTPVILMTAYGTIDRAVEAMKLGASDFITKPVNLEFLIQIINRVFKQSELERTVHEQERQLKADLHIASLVQRCMLPTGFENEFLALSLRYEPLLEIGGDYLAIRQYSDAKIAVALYDVTGHGVSAALLATLLHHELTDLLLNTQKPIEIIHRINYFASEKFSITGLFCTMALIWVDREQGLLTAINAGHPDIMVWKHTTQKFKFIPPHFPPIGLQTEDQFEFSLSRIPIDPGDRILLYTDGFIESRQKDGELLGADRFYAIASQWIHLPSYDFIDHVFQDVANLREGGANDDQTFVVVEIK